MGAEAASHPFAASVEDAKQLFHGEIRDDPEWLATV